jgi:hypothetical protein
MNFSGLYSKDQRIHSLFQFIQYFRFLFQSHIDFCFVFFLRLHSVDYIIELCANVHSNIDSHTQLNGQKQNIRDEAQRIQTESETLSLRLEFSENRNRENSS